MTPIGSYRWVPIGIVFVSYWIQAKTNRDGTGTHSEGVTHGSKENPIGNSLTFLWELFLLVFISHEFAFSYYASHTKW